MKKKSLSVKKKNHNLILKHLNDKKILKVFKEFKKSIDVKSNMQLPSQVGLIV